MNISLIVCLPRCNNNLVLDKFHLAGHAVILRRIIQTKVPVFVKIELDYRTVLVRSYRYDYDGSPVSPVPVQYGTVKKMFRIRFFEAAK